MLEVLQIQVRIPTWLMRFALHMQGRNPTGRSCGVRCMDWRHTLVQHGAESRKSCHKFSDLPLVVDLVQYRPHHSPLSLLSRPELHSFLLPAREP